MQNETSNIEGIKNYSVAELRSVSAGDRHAVRDEAMRRHNNVAKRFSKLQKELAELEALLKDVI